MRQSQKIEIRISEVEKMLIKAVAENKNITISEYVRNLIFEDLKKSGLIPVDAKSRI